MSKQLFKLSLRKGNADDAGDKAKEDQKGGDPASVNPTRVDPLDNPDFNPLQYINSLFPNEQSLVNIDKVLKRLQGKIRKLDDEIRDVVRSQTKAGEEGKKELEEAKRSINELFSKVNQIREKAEESEEMVQEITKDIKSLDYAKRHLTTSITTLRKLNMLVSAVEQLRVMSQKKQYREAAHLLQAVQQLVHFFKDYKQIKKIQELSESVAAVQIELKRQILEDFASSFGPHGELLDGRTSTLVEACELAEVLNPEVKREIESQYTEVVLRDYKTDFHFTSESGSLDKASLRFNWLARTLTAREIDTKKIFPEHWRILETIASTFCEETSRDFSLILNKADKTGNMDVKLVMATLQKTIDYEGKLAQKFSIVRQEIQPDEPEEEDDLEEKQPADTAEEIKMKYKRFQQQQRRAQEKGEKKPQVKTLPPVPNPRFHGLISGSFEPYLELYIQAEESSLQDLFDKIRNQKENLEDDSYAVMSSSNDLFFFYKNSLARCSKFSKKTPMLKLSELFGKYLLNYGELLTSKIPTETDFRKGFTDQDGKMVCLVLNTAEYCHNTTEQLEAKLKEKIDPSLADQVTLNIQKENFLNVLTECLKALQNGLLTVCGPSFLAMSKHPWGTMEGVGDQSKYVTEIGNAVKPKIQILRATISSQKYFKSCCNKFVEAFAARLISTIYKCKPISEVGAEQLLLDTQALKSILLEMTVSKKEKDANAANPATYVKLVNKEMGRAEATLKVLLTPIEPPEGLVENYIFLFANTDLANFQALLDLKGLKKNEQQGLIEVFKTHLPSTPSGESSVTQGSFNTASFPQAFDAAIQPARQQMQNAVRATMNINKLISGMKIKPGGGAMASPSFPFSNND